MAVAATLGRVMVEVVRVRVVGVMVAVEMAVAARLGRVAVATGKVAVARARVMCRCRCRWEVAVAGGAERLANMRACRWRLGRWTGSSGPSKGSLSGRCLSRRSL